MIIIDFIYSLTARRLIASNERVSEIYKYIRENIFDLMRENCVLYYDHISLGSKLILVKLNGYTLDNHDDSLNDMVSDNKEKIIKWDLPNKHKIEHNGKILPLF